MAGCPSRLKPHMRLTRRQFALQALAANAVSRSASAADEVVVFAAASLTDVLQSIVARLADPHAIRFSFAASSTLARQIEHGAPAHLFISADEAWMNFLVERRRVDPDSRRVLAANRLVVVRKGPAGPGPVPESIEALREALRPAAGGHAPSRVATGDPAHVPVGRYAQAALTGLGLWADVQDRLVRADNVRSALSFVERGEAAAGIVYASDVLVARGVQVAARFPPGSHPPIVYPGAVVTGAPPAARSFLELLASRQVQPLWRAAGFEAVH